MLLPALMSYLRAHADTDEEVKSEENCDENLAFAAENGEFVAERRDDRFRAAELHVWSLCIRVDLARILPSCRARA